MLELGRLAERVDQRLAVLEPARCARRPCPLRTARTLASGPCGPGVTFSIIGMHLLHRESGFVDPDSSAEPEVEAVVRVAPPPVLAGFGGPDHRMARLAEVGRGMPVRAQVAAARPPARQALAQVHPAGADLDARGADIERRVDVEVGLEMVAEPRHVSDGPMWVAAGPIPRDGPLVALTLPPRGG